MKHSIPKIVHQTAPKDREKWHPIWKECRKSWKRCFDESEFTHILWTDEDSDEFVKKEFNEYWGYYNQLPFRIMKKDFASMLILYKYGGIWADVDIYCYSNFYSNLDYNFYLLETFPEVTHSVESILMCSYQNNPFYLACVWESIIRFQRSDFRDVVDLDHPAANYFIIFTTGPGLTGEVYEKYKNIFPAKILPQNQYNPHMEKYDSDVVTKHMHTGMWGPDVFEDILTRFGDDTNTTDEKYIEHYKWFRDIDLNNFDFYKSYSK